MIRVLFFVLMAFGLAGFGTVAWIAARPPTTQAAAAPPPAKIAVLVATHPVGAGSLIKPDDLEAKQIAAQDSKAENLVPDSQEARRELVGAMTRRALAAGDVLREDDVIRPGQHGFLAAALKPGMRAVTITVDTQTGAGELIGPGDRVDLILTQSLQDPSLPASRKVAAETVLSDVRVLAIDLKLVLGAASPTADHSNRTVTLEVTESQAQRISVAQQLGRLSLSVRSAGFPQAVSTDPAGAAGNKDPSTVWAVDVSPALGLTQASPTPAPTGGMVRVFQGSADVKEFKF